MSSSDLHLTNEEKINYTLQENRELSLIGKSAISYLKLSHVLNLYMNYITVIHP